MRGNTKSVFIWLMPLISSFIIQGINFGWNRVVFGNLFENFLSLLILISVLLLFSLKSKILQFVVYLPWTISHLIETIYYFIFKANLSASSIYILLETNIAESREFIEFYLSPVILILLSLHLAFLVIFYFTKPLVVNHRFLIFKRSIFFVSILITIPLYLYFSGFIQYNFAFLILKSTKEYIAEYKKIESFNISQSDVQIDGFTKNSNPENATYVLVIGESTTRKRMSLYGYERNTTPYLKSISNNLNVYSDVISPNAYSIASLRKMLTLNGLVNESDFSIIQLMNKANFKTYWLSNQRPVGEFESLVTKIASASDVYQTKNTALDGSVTPLDEVLMPLFEDALSDQAPLKFIVLHPLGTHMKYSDRYSAKFEKYKGESLSNFKNKRADEHSNAYDNALLYHDKFIQSVHQKLLALEHPSYMLYLSDHGEEVFTDIDFAGHTDDNPTESMYEIPFILWTNNEFDNSKSLPHRYSLPYSTKDFMHSFSDLNQIQFEGFEPRKSIFSKNYQPSKRVIGKGLNFDTYFNN